LRPTVFASAPPSTAISPLSLHDALPIYHRPRALRRARAGAGRGHALDPPQPGAVRGPAQTGGEVRRDRRSRGRRLRVSAAGQLRSEEHTSELQSRENLVCRLLLEKKKME